MTATQHRPVTLFEDLVDGQELPEVVHTITQEQIEAYGFASLDLNPVHMDPEWAAKAQVFGFPKTVAHGMMTMSHAATLVLAAFGASANVTQVDSKFTKPVPVGSVVTIRGTVRDIHPLGGGRNHVVVSVKSTDQDGDVIGISEITVALPSA